MPGQFNVSDHPLIVHKLSYLRQPRPYVSSRDYANLMRELGMLLAVEACRHLPIQFRPSDESGIVKRFPRYFPKSRYVLEHETRPVIISVVRSGLVMAEGVREIVPTPYFGHVGVVVAPDQTLPFIVTLPESTSERVCLVVDPFVVGGTTAVEVLKLLISFDINPANICFLTLCMSREGYHRLRSDEALSGVRFFCGRVDGLGLYAPNEDWINDFVDLNERLFRTINRDESNVEIEGSDATRTPRK
jgi:uracil phosphoribosyltransferase